MKKLFLPIFASLILAAPCAHAGLADWISDNMPKSWQVSKEYRDEVRHIQEKTGNPNIPIIFTNTDEKDAIASVRNIGLGSYRFAIMNVNQRAMDQISPSERTHTLAHETAHIDKNHDGFQFTTLLSILALNAGMIVKKLYTQQSEPTYQSGIIAALSLGTIVAMGLSANEHQKNREHEAEAISFQKLSKLGYCKVLQDKHDDYKLTLDITQNPELRLRGSNYPTLAEYVKLTADALNQCGKSH